MSSDTLFEVPVGRRFVSQARDHDYVYDHLYIVSGAKDYARSAFKAAMNSSQLTIQPVFKAMFSELPRKFPAMRVVYHPNCRLPPHLDRSYRAYLKRQAEPRIHQQDLRGRDLYKFVAFPKKLLNMKVATPDFRPHAPTPIMTPGKPVNKKIQTMFRESSAQTHPWQPDAKVSEECEILPEVCLLDKLEWGPGKPYRLGDLPADFHTTEIINKIRHARQWGELVERSKFPRWMAKRDAIVTDIETKDWLFREAEIDELQNIRLELLHKMQTEQRQKHANKTSKRLSRMWTKKKEEMERKINRIQTSRDREIRKLTSIHTSGGRAGIVDRMRAARGGGSVTASAFNPTSDQHAPVLRHGYQARLRHAEITYIPELIEFVDHESLPVMPQWLFTCSTDLQKSCSGHHLIKNKPQICERFTKWGEKFLAKLHDDLKKARLGAALPTGGQLHVLKPRRTIVSSRPATPVVEAVTDEEENFHQSALLLQRIIRGRAVQSLMYEGRRRAGELTEELKTTHGLQKEDKIRIAREEFKARDYNSLRTEAEKKDDAIQALVNEVTGGAVSAALHFLEKELKRLKEERKQHAFILIALREKMMREAAEAGRRQKEEQRRREHDEIFKQILGLTQETVEAYLKEIVTDGVELAADQEAVREARAHADRIEDTLSKHGSVSTAEQNELVAELVQQFLLPTAHRTAARHRIVNTQAARLESAKQIIFNLLDDAEIKTSYCTSCGMKLDDTCKCLRCHVQVPVEKPQYRDDPRWKYTRGLPPKPQKTYLERVPPYADFRCMLNDLINEVVLKSRKLRRNVCKETVDRRVRTREELKSDQDTRALLEALVKDAVGETMQPAKKVDYYFHTMKREIINAIDRDAPRTLKAPDLPSAIRKAAEERLPKKEGTCKCVCKCVTYDEEELKHQMLQVMGRTSEGDELNVPDMAGVKSDMDATSHILPSQLRALEEMKKCKCDSAPPASPISELVHESLEVEQSDPSDYDFSSTTTTPRTKFADQIDEFEIADDADSKS